jgi:hypothetical protein
MLRIITQQAEDEQNYNVSAIAPMMNKRFIKKRRFGRCFRR